MALRTYRFGIRNAQGARSSEWIVIWKTNTSDVYLVTRSLGESLKASIHESGRCHVRAPDPSNWRGTMHPPAFLLEWNIDPASHFSFPFSIVVPEQELRHAEWPLYKEKGTEWILASPCRGTEVAVFLIRSAGDQSTSLQKAGWKTLVVDASLPDGRRLLVAVGESVVAQEKLDELRSVKAQVRRSIQREGVQLGNPRLVLVADANENGTRTFVEAAVLE